MVSAAEHADMRHNSISYSSGSSAWNSEGMNTRLTADQKRQRILRHWDRKRQRLAKKKEVRYECRKSLADKRFRHHGRFISMEQFQKIMA